MNQNHQQPRWDVPSRDNSRGESERSGDSSRSVRGEAETEVDRARSSPSVAPMAYQLEEEAEDPAPTPPQAMSTFARNVIIATVAASAVFIAFGMWRSLMLLALPDETSTARPHTTIPAEEPEPWRALVSEGARMSMAPSQAAVIASEANARARMSLLEPVEAPVEEALPPVRRASEVRSTKASLVDAATQAAVLRCLDASDAAPVRVHVRFGPEGRVASVDFGRAAGGTEERPAHDLACVEEVFSELEIAEFGGGERTFSRDLAW